MTGRHGFLFSSVAVCALVMSATPSLAAQPRATFEFCSPQRSNYGDLDDRLRQAIGEAGGNELATASRRRASTERAIELATELLRSEGYYGGYVSHTETTGTNAPPHLCVYPGTRFTVDDPAIKWTDSLLLVNITNKPTSIEDEANIPPATASDIAPPNDPASNRTITYDTRVFDTAPPVRPADDRNEARNVVEDARKAIQLEGKPARAEDIIAAEARILRALREDGFADARAHPRQVHVIHPDTRSAVSSPQRDPETGEILTVPSADAEAETPGNETIARLAEQLHQELIGSTPPAQNVTDESNGAISPDSQNPLDRLQNGQGADGNDDAALPAPVPESQRYAGHTGNVVIPFFVIQAGQLVRLKEDVFLLGTDDISTSARGSLASRAETSRSRSDDRNTAARDSRTDEDTPRTRTRPKFVQSLVTWKEGDIYSPELLNRLEKDLSDTGVYNSVSVNLERPAQPIQTIEDGVAGPTRNTDTADTDALREVQVQLVDRDKKLLEAAVSYATQDGVGVELVQSQFNRFGQADTLRYILRLADIDSRIGLDWTRPHFRKRGRTISASAFVVNEITDAYERQALTIDADVSERRGDKWWASVGLGLDTGRYAEVRYDPITQQALNLDRDLAIVTLRGAMRTDQSNDPLDPTQGWKASLSVQPTAVTGEDTVFFLRTVGDASAYYGLGEDDATVLAGRVKIGSIVGGDELVIPSSRLMYSGGGGSVRGYSYQSINPRLPDNTPRGGLGLFEASFEVRRDVRDNWQAVAFVDAGAVGFEATPNLSNMRYGAGVGVRYKLPFGPIRADVAFPLNKREGDSDFQLYISIGQSF
ncbi:BamA/TamA family outer membrane protein [Brevundimonas sp. BH3]|uniref:autotransporter assembly complex protein TamA n=1 Tax=Brevundimonas sp. BH3 TaxID=3133089 RepID=UPI0032550C08